MVTVTIEIHSKSMYAAQVPARPQGKRIKIGTQCQGEFLDLCYRFCSPTSGV